MIILKKENYEGDKKDDRDLFVLVTSASVGEVLAFKQARKKGQRHLQSSTALAGAWKLHTGTESSRPRTTSKNESIRILLLFLPIFLYNTWNLAKYHAGSWT